MKRPSYEEFAEFLRKKGLATTMNGQFMGEWNLLPLSVTEEEVWYRIFNERLLQQQVDHLEKVCSKLEERIKNAADALGYETEDDYD